MFDPKVVKILALISQVGISMLVPIFMMVWLGSWVDEKFHTQFFPIFILLGIAAGFRNSYILIMNAMKERKKETGNHEETDK